MKKFLTFLTLLTALSWLPTGVFAQELTVADGTEQTGYVPVYGLYADMNQQNQMVYPADMLAEMVGTEISGLTFYISQMDEGWPFGADITVSLGTVDNFSPFSSYSPTLISTTFTEVFSGSLSPSGDLLVVTFSEGFLYEGGDLVVQFETQPNGEYPNVYFYAQSADESRSAYTYNGSWNGGGSEMVLPKCTFTYELQAGACGRVKGLAVETSTTSIDVSWIDTVNSGATYAVQLISPTDTQVVAPSVSTTSYTINGLNANTPYTVRVKSICPDGNESSWASISTRTNCDPITLPFHEGFEDYTNNTFPDCWHLFKGYSNYPYVYQSTPGNIPEGSKYLYMATNNATDSNFFRTDLIPVVANEAHISFWAGGAGIVVGYMTSQNDRSTFHPLLTTSGNSWRQYDIYCDTLSDVTNGIYLAVLLTGSSRSCALDDLKVETISDCRRPAAAPFSDITYLSATANWTPEGDATAWDIVIDSVFGNPDTMNVAASAVEATSYQFTDLLSNKTYLAWVRANCGTSVSDWRYLGGFTTDRSCYAVENASVDNVNYTSAFVTWNYAGNGRGLEETGVHLTLRDANSILREWDMAYADGSSTFVTGLEAATAYTLEIRTFCDPDSASAVVLPFSTSSCGEVSGNGSTTSYVPFYGYYNYGVSQALYPADAVASMPAISGLMWNVASAATSTPTRTIDVFIGYTDQTSLDVSSPIDTNALTKVVTNGQLNVGQTGWTAVTFDQPFPVSASGSNLVVMVVNKTGDYYSFSWAAHEGVGIYAYNDYVTPSTAADFASYSSTYKSSTTSVADIRFLGECETECLAPNLGVTAVTANSVELQWVPGGDEASWVLQYRHDTADVWTTFSASVNTNSETIEDLAPATLYHFRLGTVCGETDTLWSTTSVYTGCAPLEELPLVENFEQQPLDQDPLCWSVYDYASSSYSRHYVVSNGHNGGKAMYMYPYGVQYLVSPRLPDGTNVEELEINFWASLSDYGRRLDVGYMTDPADTNTFHSLFTTAPNGSTWTEYTFYGNANSNTVGEENVYIAFRWYVNSGYNGYIDDVTIRVSTCQRPGNIAASELLANQATLTWDGAEDATFEYYLSTTNNAPADTVEDAEYETIDGPTVSFEGLQPNTLYYFWVRTVCDGAATAWTAFSFRTSCLEMTFPYLEDFEANANYARDILCWTVVQNYNSYGTIYPYVYAQSDASQNKSVYLYHDGSTAPQTVLASPYIPAALNELEIAFDYVRSNGSMKVYAATNPADQTTWTLLKTVNSSNSLDDDFTTHELMTDTINGVSATPGYLLFVEPSGYNAGYLDNVYITRINACRRPAAVTTSDTTAYTVRVSWTPVEGASAYRVKYSQVNNEALATDSVDVDNDTTVVLTGLQNGSTYYLWVYNVCDNGRSDARTATVQTLVSCYPVANLTLVSRNLSTAAFAWDIDPRGNEAQNVLVTLHDLTDPSAEDITETAQGLGYHMISGLNPEHSYSVAFRTACDVDSSAALTVTLTAQPCGEAAGDESDYSSYIPMYSYYNNSYTQALYPATAVEGMTQITGLSWHIKTSVSLARTVNVYIGRTSATSVSGNAIPLSSLTQVAANVPINLSQEGWTSINFTTPWTVPTSGGDNIVVAVVAMGSSYVNGLQFYAHPGVGGYAYSDGSVPTSLTSTSTSVADIRFLGNCERDVDACQSPVVVVSNITTNSADVIWSGNNESYEVQYAPAGDTNWITAESPVSPVTLTDLASGTIYQVRVIGHCDTNVYNSNTFFFNTECEIQHIPFDVEQADIIAIYDAGFTPCWEVRSFSASSSGSTYYLRSGSSSGRLVLPAIEESLSTAQLRLHMAGMGLVAIGILESDSTITPIENISMSGSEVSNPTEYVVYLDSYNGSGNRIVIENTTYNSIYITDMHVEPLETCRPVTNLTAGNTTESSATITWTAGEANSQWLVYLNDSLIATTTTPTYSLTNLSTSTAYTVTVRGLCSDTDTTRPVTVRIHTSCGDIADFPWTEDFEAGIDCWTNVDSDGDGQMWKHNTESENAENEGHNGSTGYAASFSWDDQAYSPDNWLISPAIILPANNEATLTWFMSCDENYPEENMSVYVATSNDVATLSATEAVYTYLCSAADAGWTEHTVSLEAYGGQTVYIAFRHHDCNDQWGLYIDDVTITLDHEVGPGPQPVECNAPVIASANATDSTIVLSWTGSAQSYEWAIVEGANWTAPNAGTATSATSVTIEQLTRNTEYTVGVRSVCDSGERSEWATRTVTTTNVGIDDVLGQSFALFPNPASVSVTVDLGENGVVSILDAAGRESGKWNAENGRLTIDLSGYAAGAYYVRVVTANGTAVRKLIVR